MDCNMPVMDGFEATTQIRNLSQNGFISYKPFICALTAYTTNAFKNKCLGHKMD